MSEFSAERSDCAISGWGCFPDNRSYLYVVHLLASSLKKPFGISKTDTVPEPEIHLLCLQHHVDMRLAHLLGADSVGGGTISQANDLDGFWKVIGNNLTQLPRSRF